MKLPKINHFFPANNAMAELYGGWLDGHYFKRTFSQETHKERLEAANAFIKENGFEFVVRDEFFDEEHYYEKDGLSLDFNTLDGNTLLLVFRQPPRANQLDSLFNLLDLFREDRDWKQFHTPKNLAMALSAESGELLDQFLWDREKDLNVEKAADEIADVFVYLLLLSKELDIDLLETVVKKIMQNNSKYPVSKAKSTAKKYNEL